MKKLNTEIKDFHGINVKIKHLGTGQFKNIDICDDKGNIIYHFQKDISPLSSLEDFKILRRVYFNCEEKPTRIYRGWRNSFIEFCCFVAKFKKMPTSKKLIASAKKLRISKNYASIYAEYYEKFFIEKRKSS